MKQRDSKEEVRAEVEAAMDHAKVTASHSRLARSKPGIQFFFSPRNRPDDSSLTTSWSQRHIAKYRQNLEISSMSAKVAKPHQHGSDTLASTRRTAREVASS